MKSFKILFAGLALASVAGAQAQVTKQGQNYLFRYKYAKGKSFTTNISATTSVTGIELPKGQKASDTQNLKVVVNVTDFAKDIATLKVTVSQNGKSEAPQTIKSNTRGKVTGANDAGNNIGVFIYPEKAIPVGHKWNAKTSMKQGQVTIATDTNYVFKGFKDLNGKKYAYIEATGVANSIVKMDFKTTYYVDMVDGFVHTSTTNMTGKVPVDSKKTGTVSVTITTKRA